MIKSIKEINTDTPEGKLLMAALAKLSVESNKEPDEIVQEVNALARKMYIDSNLYLIKFGEE